MRLLVFIYDAFKCCHQESWREVPQRTEFDSKDVKHSEWTCEIVNCYQLSAGGTGVIVL